MSRWFRHYGGMARDEKLVSVAVKSRQTVERVIWVWTAILESASEISDGGRFDLDAAEAAYFLRANEDDICSIMDALANAGRISSGVVVKWSDRQYESDKSAERQARYRERKKSGGNNKDLRVSDGNVTSRDAVVTAQDTDTDTDTDTEKKDIILSPKSAPKPRNGSRLPDDWVLPKAWGNWALENIAGATIESVRSQADQFRDYWVGKAGASARKADWEATWRNWMRNAAPKLQKTKPMSSLDALEMDLKERIQNGTGSQGSLDFASVPRLSGRG